MKACAFPSAWTDPEHVRLASFRSWWDAGTSERGPLPDDLNPWLTDAHPEHTSSPQPQSRRLAARHDEYAGTRCRCSHLAYADEYPGCFCRFCKCTDHRAVTG